jgi:tripartite-type tricarboxylate transporter receptor subunit TctC
MDINARNIGQKLAETLGQQVVIDSRPGATGMIANEIVAKSAPDGYTLLAAPGSAVVAAPHLQKVSFDILLRSR